ncbi:transposase [Streptomyces vinaceus]
MSRHWRICGDTRVRFVREDCDPCPLRSRCTRATDGKYGRSLILLPRDRQEGLGPAASRAADGGMEGPPRIRAGVEGTVSQAARRTRSGARTPCRGRPTTHLANLLSAAAVNLIRLDARTTGLHPGGTHTSHPARLALAA